MDTQRFHRDELTAQRLAGGGSAGGGIRDSMPDQHRLFFGGLPYVVMAAVDTAGWPAATMLTGPPGFIQTPDAHTLRIGLTVSGDPTIDALAPGQDFGIIGIDFATRRRNRANGVVQAIEPAGLTIAVHQSFGNCPKYIRRRTVQSTSRTPSPVETLPALDGAARALITGADTFFVASRSRPEAGALGGADVSHRGGPSGFVALDHATLTIPDFPGNRYFNTFGNLLGDRRAALLFLDFERGDVLHVQGDAEIDWRASPETGSERVWRLHTTHAWRRRAAVPLEWSCVA